MKYKYTTGGDVKWAIKFESDWDTDELEFIAEDAAQVEFNSHDSWESNWPKTFTIFDLSGFMLGQLKVELEFEPVFYAHAVAKTEEKQNG